MKLEANVLELIHVFADHGGTAIVVGGAVRDHLLGTESNDIDIEVHGLSWDLVTEICQGLFKTDLCGESFSVLKLTEAEIDVSIPRRESRTGESHTDFDVTADPHMGFAEAASRRDFTINAIGYNPLTQELVDPHNGAADLEKRILRHVSRRFAEDALRVMRGAQFASRFGLTMHPETAELCSALSPEHLALERLSVEWVKLLKGSVPSRGLKVLRDVNWLRHFPVLAPLDLRIVGSRLNNMSSSDETLLWAGLVLDLQDGAGAAVTELSGLVKEAGKVQALVTHLSKTSAGTQLRHSAKALSGVRSLLTLAVVSGLDVSESWTQAESEGILDAPPVPLVTGKDLLDQGMEPGPDLGTALSLILTRQFNHPALTKDELLVGIN